MEGQQEREEPPVRRSGGCYEIRKHAGISFEELEEHRSRLTVTPMRPPGLGPPPAFEIYYETDEAFFVPRFYAHEFLAEYCDEKQEDGKEEEKFGTRDLPFVGELTEMQQIATAKCLEAYESTGGGILSIFCGGGKTICGLYLVSVMKHKTLVIVHKEFLMNQWRDRIAQFLPSARVGFIQQTKVDIANKDIVIAMLQSLSMRDYDDKVLKDFKHVIFDECHHIGARVFSQAMYRISKAKYILGLSATPKRRDGLTFVLQWFLGDVVYLAERSNTGDDMEVKAKVLLVRQKTSSSSSSEGGGGDWDNEEDEENQSSDDNEEEGEGGTSHRDKRRKKVVKSPKGERSGGMLTDLVTTVAQREGRNRVIAEQIVACCREGRKILVLSDRIKHLRLIDRQLSSLATERGQDRVDSGFYIGGMSFEELQTSSKKSVLLGSYPMSSEGLDIPSLDTILLATPRASVEQSVGRIMRHGATSDRKPLILDIVDEDESPFRRSAKKRIRYYRKSGYKVTTLSFVYNPGEEDIECQPEDTETKKSKKKKGKKTAADWKNLNKECPEEAKSEGALFAKRFQFKTMPSRLLGGRGQIANPSTEENSNTNESSTAFTPLNRRSGLTSPPKTTTTTTTTTTTPTTTHTSPQRPQQHMKAVSPVKGNNSTSPHREHPIHKRKLEEISPPQKTLSAPTINKKPSTITPTSPQKQQPHTKSVSPVTQQEQLSHKRKLEEDDPLSYLKIPPAHTKRTTPPTIPKPRPTTTTTTSPTGPKKTSPVQPVKKASTSPSEPISFKRQKLDDRTASTPATLKQKTTSSTTTPPKKQVEAAASQQVTKKSPTSASSSLLQCQKCGKPYTSYFPHSC